MDLGDIIQFGTSKKWHREATQANQPIYPPWWPIPVWDGPPDTYTPLGPH